MFSNPPNKAQVVEMVKQVLMAHSIDDPNKLASISEMLGNNFGILLTEHMTNFSSRIMTSSLMGYHYSGPEDNRSPEQIQSPSPSE